VYVLSSPLMNLYHANPSSANPELNPPSPLPKPGSYSYSNTNHTLLGLIVEYILSSPITSIMHKRIHEPLSLSHTYLEGYEEPKQGGTTPNRYHHLTPTYLETAGQSLHLSPSQTRPDLLDVTPTNLSVSWMAGGFISHPTDLCNFALAIRNSQLLSPASLERMNQFISTETEGKEVGYGVFKLDKGKNGVWYGHTGGVLGFSASLFWSEKYNVAVAALSNAGVVHAGKVINVTNIMSDDAFLEGVLEWAEMN
jgi:D-alanyl-D-alanine carboxypeptidase